MHSERRRTSRHHVRLLVENCADEIGVIDETFNLSIDGLRLKRCLPLDVGSTVNMIVHVPGERGSLAPDRVPGVLVVRSLTKLWALPGVRAGHVLGSPEVVAALARGQAPWAVPGPAVAAVVACCSPAAAAEPPAGGPPAAAAAPAMEAARQATPAVQAPPPAPAPAPRLPAGTDRAAPWSPPPLYQG